jgi:hypothetical protein
LFAGAASKLDQLRFQPRQALLDVSALSLKRFDDLLHARHTGSFRRANRR